MSSPLLDGIELKSRMCEIAGLEVQSAKTPQGGDITVILVRGEVSTAARAAFDRIVRFGAFGGLQVERADSTAIIASPWATGTVAALPSLGWRLSERLEVFQEIAQLVKNFHDQGCAAGPFDPNYLLLDSDFRPFMLGPSIAPVDTPYTAPETVQSARVDKSSDIFSLGRLLHFILTEQPPTIAAEDPARLDELVTYPAGLSRIIRKAIRRDPRMRYKSIDEMLTDLAHYGRYEDVGIGHPDVEEQNLGGVSHRPPPRVAVAQPKDQPQAHQAAMVDFQKIEPFKLKQQTRGAVLLAGLGAILVAFVLNYLVGDGLWIRVMLTVSAALVGFALFNPGIDKESSVRLSFATFFACAMFVWNPTPYLAKLAEQAGLNQGSAEDRATSFKKLSERGQVEYSGVDLSGADLAGQRFFFTKMDGVSFRGANLTGSEFFNVDLSGADFQDADISGALFESTSVDRAANFDGATCNGKTRFPADWDCVNNHPEQTTTLAHAE